jgi:hypothetical protein
MNKKEMIISYYELHINLWIELENNYLIDIIWNQLYTKMWSDVPSISYIYKILKDYKNKIWVIEN